MPASCRASTSFLFNKQDVDGRDKPGHDDAERPQRSARDIQLISGIAGSTQPSPATA